MKKKSEEKRILFKAGIVIAVTVTILVSTVGVSALENRLPMKCQPIHRIIFVDDDNTQGPWDGSLLHPFQHIQDGINVGCDGDTVSVSTGTYQESVEVNRSIYLIGENKDTTFILSSEPVTVHISSDQVTISGFWMRSDFLYLEGAALFISSDNNTVYDNMILQSRWYGIALSGSSHNTISGNYIACNHVGISMWESSYNTIATNIIVSQNPSNQGGISLTFSSHNVISGNLIANNPNGILLWYSACHNTISENIFQTNTYGVALRYSYNNLPSNYNKIYHNNFIDNTVNAYDECDGNMWDNGYPSGGNYWDNHQGPWQDGYSGPDQTIPCPEGDGIIDLPSGGLNPYTIFGGENLDLYPLIEPYAQAGDVVVPEVCREERSSTLLKKG